MRATPRRPPDDRAAAATRATAPRTAARPAASCTWRLSSIDEGRCFWNAFQNLSSAFHAGFGSGHAPSPGGNSTSSLSQTVANAESRSFGRMSASSNAIMSGSPAARALVMNSRHTRWRSSRSCTSSSSVKPGRHAGFDRTLAQQPRAERVNGAGEEALQIRQRRPQPRDASASRRLGLARATASLASSARWKRPRSSDAAFRVKVTAAMCSTWYTPSATPAAIRSASICVLPEPAPASTRMFSSSSSRMVRRDCSSDRARISHGPRAS